MSGASPRRGSPRAAIPPPSALRRRTASVHGKARIAIRWPTASRRLLPDYIIIGSQKSGTTSLQAALSQHPAIVPACTREVHYFDRNIRRGSGWYRAHFPTGAERERILSRQGQFATGAKSPDYLVDPAVPARVSALLPDVKLIVLLRDPVARALSHYHHKRRRGNEPLSFEEAVARELQQSEPRDLGRPCSDQRSRSYLARGRYAEQLERWLHYFDREQIRVTLSERLFADPAGAVCELQKFIGLTPVVPDDLRPRGKAAYEPMGPPLRLQLQQFFSEDVTRLTALLGSDPGWW